MPDAQRPLFTGQLGDREVVLVVTGRNLGATPFTANTTVIQRIPTPPGVFEITRISVSSTVVGNDADGTLIVQAFKYRAATDDRVALTDNLLNVENLVAREKTAMTITAATADRQFAAADTIEIDLVSNSAAIDTQPTDLTFVIECAMLS